MFSVICGVYVYRPQVESWPYAALLCVRANGEALSLGDQLSAVTCRGFSDNVLIVPIIVTGLPGTDAGDGGVAYLQQKTGPNCQSL